MKNVVWSIGNGNVVVTSLENCGMDSKTYVEEGLSSGKFTSTWVPIFYDTEIPDLEEFCVWDGVSITVNNTKKVSLTMQQIEFYVENILESLAQSWGYKDSSRLSTYATSTIPQYKSDADKFVAYRDLLWNKLEQDKVSFMSGTLSMPSSTLDYISTLPQTPAR